VLDEAPQLEVQNRAVGMPENQPRPDVLLNRIQIELLPDDAVIALARLFEPANVGLEIVLAEPRRAVDALQHLPPLIAAPIRPRRVQQLEVLDPPRTRHVRPATQLDERPVRVHRDPFTFLQLIYSL